MFTRLELSNFRSFDNIVFDLTEKSNIAKKLSIIYGENGSGKSNLVSAFVLLTELFQTMNVRDSYEEILNQTARFKDEEIKQRIRDQLFSEMRDIKAIIDDYRMVDSTSPITAKYEFCIGGNKGAYYIELGEEEIIREKLEYRLNQRKGIYFDCDAKSITINSSIIRDKDLMADIKATAKRFWGKHSILAIITHELEDKATAFGKENLTENFCDVLAELEEISCNVGIGAKEWSNIYAPNRVFSNPIEGRILAKNEQQLDLAAEIFTKFFKAINSDYKQVSYQKSFTDKYVEYRLFVTKLVADTYRIIDFAKESKGTHQLLKLLCYLLTACNNGIVVLDEADSGIHDLLFKKIVLEILPCIRGQIILTTHNTMLMESQIDKDTIYILSEQEGGHRSVRCITDYEKRTFLGNNIRNKYLNNEYNGLPTVDKIDFQSLIDCLYEQ